MKTKSKITFLLGVLIATQLFFTHADATTQKSVIVKQNNEQINQTSVNENSEVSLFLYPNVKEIKKIVVTAGTYEREFTVPSSHTTTEAATAFELLYKMATRTGVFFETQSLKEDVTINVITKPNTHTITVKNGSVIDSITTKDADEPAIITVNNTSKAFSSAQIKTGGDTALIQTGGTIMIQNQTVSMTNSNGQTQFLIDHVKKDIEIELQEDRLMKKTVTIISNPYVHHNRAKITEVTGDFDVTFTPQTENAISYFEIETKYETIIVKENSHLVTTQGLEYKTTGDAYGRIRLNLYDIKTDITVRVYTEQYTLSPKKERIYQENEIIDIIKKYDLYNNYNTEIKIKSKNRNYKIDTVAINPYGTIYRNSRLTPNGVWSVTWGEEYGYETVNILLYTHHPISISTNTIYEPKDKAAIHLIADSMTTLKREPKTPTKKEDYIKITATPKHKNYVVDSITLTSNEETVTIKRGDQRFKFLGENYVVDYKNEKDLEEISILLKITGAITVRTKGSLKEKALLLEEITKYPYPAYIKGISSNRFSPNGTVKRSEAMVMMTRLFFSPSADTLKKHKAIKSYEDIFENAWYAGDVNYLYAKNYLANFTHSQFIRPHEPITRAEVAALLVSIAPNDDIRGEFEDVTENTPHKRAIEIAKGNGWITGYNNKFRPNATITRAELVTILNRVTKRPLQNTASPFMDVKPTDWYYNDVISAIQNIK